MWNSKTLFMLVILGSVASVRTSDGAPPARWFSQLGKIQPKLQSVAGDWTVQSDGLRTNAATGSRIAFTAKMPREYDMRIRFTRHSGQHSIALIFTSGSGRATFELDAWGQNLAGIQNIAGKTFQFSAGPTSRVRLENGRQYTAELRVRRDSVTCFLDDKQIAIYQGDGSDLTLHPSWSMPVGVEIGVGAYEAETTFHAIDLRLVQSDLQAGALAKSTLPLSIEPKPIEPIPSESMPIESVQEQSPPAKTPLASKGVAAKPRRVLLVIANQDFFYREYADPREELTRAGFIVEVAAGHAARCYPHAGSGQVGSGAVTPDLRLSQVDPNRYAAIVFSGGWGSSMYQYAFTGRYDETIYNGEPSTKDTVNRLINAFAEQDKFICGICNAVSVLAWSRVNGKSLLTGKSVTAPIRNAPNGIYDGRRDAPSIHWHVRKNGGNLISPSELGSPNSTADDVVVDGKIITAADDQSAREAGRRLALLLKAMP